MEICLFQNRQKCKNIKFVRGKHEKEEMSCVRFFFSVRTGGSSAASVCVFYAGMHEGDIPRRAFIRNATLIFRKLQTFYVIVLR